MRQYNESDNAGVWRHEDGTRCPSFWSDRATSPDGQQWWCTEHQQHLHVGGEVA